MIWGKVAGAEARAARPADFRSFGLAAGVCCLTAFLAGCGSDGADTLGGSGGSGGDGFGGDSVPCFVDLSVSGAITRTFSANGCGTSGGSMSWSNLGNGQSSGVSISFSPALEPKQTGEFLLQGLSVHVNSDADGVARWRTADGACSVVVEANQAVPHEIFENRHDVRLHGSCSAPALAEETTVATGELTIAPFRATGFINPRP